ncbi:MAG: hypothetical protein ABS93_02910 [Thiobacillus sp. SCN 62-729]|nr:MAG: hypothetical protein ABS93_02910 [Thiobacillus sp. SCN 62-729]
MLDGKDYRAWQRGLPPHSTAPASVRLALTLTQTANRMDVQADSRFDDPAARHDAQLYLALTENRLNSEASAGENARRVLHHDHVVRQLAGPFDPHHARQRFRLQLGWKAADLGVTAFVLDARGATLQALALPACP